MHIIYPQLLYFFLDVGFCTTIFHCCVALLYGFINTQLILKDATYYLRTEAFLKSVIAAELAAIMLHNLKFKKNYKKQELVGQHLVKASKPILQREYTRAFYTL